MNHVMLLKISLVNVDSPWIAFWQGMLIISVTLYFYQEISLH